MPNEGLSIKVDINLSSSSTESLQALMVQIEEELEIRSQNEMRAGLEGETK